MYNSDCSYDFEYLNGKFYILDNSSNWYIANGQTLTKVCSDVDDQRSNASIRCCYNGIIYYVEYNVASYGGNNYFVKAFDGTKTWTLCSEMFADTMVFALNGNLYMFGCTDTYYNIYTLDKKIILQTHRTDVSLEYYGDMILLRSGKPSTGYTYYIFNGNSMTQTNMFDNKHHVILSKYTLNGNTIGMIYPYKDIEMYNYDTDTVTTIISSSALDYPDTGNEYYVYEKRIYRYIVYNEDIFMADNITRGNDNRIPIYIRISKFTAPENVYNPNTLIIDKSNLFSGGKYSTEIAAPKIENNQRFLTGFDDCFYFADTAFDWNAPMYYGNGSQWIKFKN